MWELARLIFGGVLAAAWLVVIVAGAMRCPKCGRWCESPAECQRLQDEQ
ncbi:MAG TPA: hypothetical protein VN829_20975 [Dongiaceae bacterium]|nr:hypothetical protein [Dongiaceae bacterium]